MERSHFHGDRVLTNMHQQGIPAGSTFSPFGSNKEFALDDNTHNFLGKHLAEKKIMYFALYRVYLAFIGLLRLRTLSGGDPPYHALSRRALLIGPIEFVKKGPAY